jgi:hypothetical protein
MRKVGGCIIFGIAVMLNVFGAERRAARIELPETDVIINPEFDSGLRKLIRVAEKQIAQSERQEQLLQERRRKLLEAKTFAQMSYADLKRYFSESDDDFISEKDLRGLKLLTELATWAIEAPNGESRQRLIWQLREVAAAIGNNHRSPSPPHMDLFQPPLYYMDYAHNPIGKGEEPANNLEHRIHDDLSLLDPLPSTFWSRPKSIPKEDLFAGFDRATIPGLENQTWSYAGPKTSYGGCPGFEAQSGATKIKVKFAETTSEPFTARIFWALGYHVEPTDYIHSLKLRYDRRFFREFHLRKDVQMKVRALFIPVYTVNLQERHDPFDYIVEAVLKSGERVPGCELKARLLRIPEAKEEHLEDFPENFRPEFEAQIAYLVTTPANVQIREEHTKSIGPWDFHSLDHAARRELRALGLLGAWVGWFDSRFENTRLKIVRQSRTDAGDAASLPELRHYLTDLGGGLGKAKGVLSRHCECPNDFGWRFTRPPKTQGKTKMTIPFKIVDYQPIEDTEAFRQMTYDDARWMARLIAQLTEAQIVQALVASGFDATEVKIYTEKLVNRRDWMIRDLGLADEIPPLRATRVNESFSFDPQTHKIPVAQLKDGALVTPRTSELVIANGIVFPKGHTRTPLERAQLASHQRQNIQVAEEGADAFVK